ncbi:MAG: hypothetical protein V3U92_05155 [Cellulophaga sp.]
MFEKNKLIGKSPLAPNATNKKDYWEEVFKTYNINLDVSQISPDSTIVSFPQRGVLKILKDEDTIYTRLRKSTILGDRDPITSLGEIKELDRKNNFGFFAVNKAEVTVINKHALRLIQIEEYKNVMLDPNSGEFVSKNAFLTIDKIAKIDGINVTPHKDIKFGQ